MSRDTTYYQWQEVGPSVFPLTLWSDSADILLRVEIAVKQILCGTNVKTSASVANANCLDWYRSWNAEH